MSATSEIRKSEGQFGYVDDAVMLAHGVERTGNCAACGRRIELHVGVQSPTKRMMWVGGDCAATLTMGDAPASVVTVDGVREYVTPSAEWAAALRDAAYVNFERRIYRNQFLASVYRQFESRRRLTVKQFAAASAAMV